MKESLWIQVCSTKLFEQSLLLALPKGFCPQGSVNLSYSDLPAFQKNLNSKEGSSPSALVRACGTGLGSGGHLGECNCESRWELQRFGGGTSTVPGLHEVTRVTRFSCRLGLRCPRSLLSNTAAASPDRIFVPPQTEETQGLDSAPNFKIQE